MYLYVSCVVSAIRTSRSQTLMSAAIFHPHNVIKVTAIFDCEICRATTTAGTSPYNSNNLYGNVKKRKKKKDDVCVCVCVCVCVKLVFFMQSVLTIKAVAKLHTTEDSISNIINKIC